MNKKYDNETEIMMCKIARPLIWAFLTVITIIFAACRAASFQPPSATETPNVNPSIAEFNFAQGTIWVYSYVPYQQIESKPTEIISATYLITDTVVDAQYKVPFYVAQIKREEELVSAPTEWGTTTFNQPAEYWYIIESGKIYETFQAIDLNIIETDTLILAFDFPLTKDKSWCPFQFDLKDPNRSQIDDCHSLGKRTVVKSGSYEVPLGKLDDCYQIIEDINSGGRTIWFCKEIGVIAVKYDHVGTRFGFTQLLVDYKKGSP